MILKWDDSQHYAMTKWDDDESLKNNQFDEDLLGWYEEEYHAEDWTTRLYTTINLMRTRDIVRRSDLSLCEAE
jgi:hypothetical protein